MGVFDAIVQPFMLSVFDAKANLRPRGAVRTELVSDHDARRRDSEFQEIADQPPRRTGVSAGAELRV
jgi:hypothetical protein